TATETYDYLRLLFARAGRTYCPQCGQRVVPDTVQSVTDALLALPEGTRILITFPLPRSARIAHRTVVENLRALGFVRGLVDGATIELDEASADDPAVLGHDLAGAEELLVVVDRAVVRADASERIADSVGIALREGEGEIVAVDATAATRLRFSERFHCPDHPDIRFLDPSPRLFSFNNPYGSCPTCTGFGAVLEYDPSLIVPNVDRTLDDGAVDPWEKPRYHKYRSKLLAYARAQGASLEAPWADLDASFRDAVIHGARGFTGVIPFLQSREPKRYKQYIRVFLRHYQSAHACPECGGAKLRHEALYVRVCDMNIAEASELPASVLLDWAEGLQEGEGGALALAPQERAIAAPILRELVGRLRFLDDVGLGYLTLHRQTRTLSGGEAQRISLANSLGSALTDTLYVLDEPTIGLHPGDTDRLLDLLKQLRARGNSVIVVEHDAAAIRVADHVVELGPGSGERGGTIVFEGSCAALLEADTATGRFLSGRDGGAPVRRKRALDTARIRLHGARH
ncbi:MAG: hypothetical protein ACREKM_10020, partial [Longimicrobiales bacterium]